MQHQTAIKPLTIIAIMLMVFSVSAVVLVDFEESDALSAYSGGSNRSSESDPYSSIVIDAADFRTGNTTIYVERGGSVSVTNNSNVGNLDVNAGMGIVDNGQTLSGTLSPRSSSNTVAYIYLDNVTRLTVNIVDPEPETTPVTSVTISGSSQLSKEVGDTGSLTATVSPSDATNKNVTWKTSDSSVVSISGSGTRITYNCRDVGEATITCTASDGSGKSDSVTIVVEEPVILVESVTISCGDSEFLVGEEYTLDVDVYPSDADNDTITWDVTAGSSLITIDRETDSYFRFIADAPGSVTIRAEANDYSGEYDTFSFTITEPMEDFIVKYEMDGGSPQLSQQSDTSAEDTVRFIIPGTVPVKTGYDFKGWKASDGTIYQPGSDFYAVPGTNTLTAQWELKQYTCYINFVATGATPSTIPPNDSYTGTSTSDHNFIIPNTVPERAGYTFVEWLGDNGQRYQPGTSVPVSYNGTVTLTAQWTQNTLEISGTPSTTALTTGTTWSFTPTVNVDGYTLKISGADWLVVSGNSVTGTPTQSGQYTITITAEKDNYTSDSMEITLNVVPQLSWTNAPTGGAIIYGI